MYSTWKFSTNTEDTWQQCNYVNISDFLKIYIFYLRNCSIVVEPLVPGRPSSYFPPLPRTGLRPFLRLFPFSPNASPACLFRGNGVKTQAETAPTLSAASGVANLHKHNSPGKVWPNAVNFPARSSSSVLKRPGSVSDGRRGFKKTTVYLPYWV